LVVLVLAASSLGLQAGGSAAGAWQQAAECANPPFPPDVRSIVYSSPAPGVDLTLDVYEAPGPGPFPSLVIVHGGSYKSGCKGELSQLADRFRDAGFTVFNISIRSSCLSTNPPSKLDDPAYCSGHGVAPKPVVDVENAVGWIRQHAPEYGGDPDRIAAIGDSSGGGLATTAGDLGTPGGTAPDAVASWSGGSELDYWADGTPSCAPGNNVCVAARTNYIGCSVTVCDDQWKAMSPYDVATSTSSPALLAAGTNEETVRYQESVDYMTRLNELGVVHSLCTVSTSKHGKLLQDKPCNETGETTFDTTVAFFLAVL
jgi:alpha-L-fucosidase 2